MTVPTSDLCTDSTSGNGPVRCPDPVALRADHLPQALQLSRALQWPYRLEDWAFALGLGRGLAVEIDGRLAGTALWWPYGDHHASAGMIIVAADQQRKGIGGALMDALLADAAGRTILLNSTEEGLGLYTRLGFVAHGQVNQHQAVLAQSVATERRRQIRALEAGDRVAIGDLDRAASGMDRRALLDALFAMSDVRVIDHGGRISAYGCVRGWGRGVVIGPVVADEADDARALIANLAAAHVGEFVRIDVPADTALSPWLETIGLPQVNQVVAMALGELPRVGAAPRLFALSNQSLG
jgi:ribosomal protein S18 acetylase RimI-like enzyme